MTCPWERSAVPHPHTHGGHRTSSCPSTEHRPQTPHPHLLPATTTHHHTDDRETTPPGRTTPTSGSTTRTNRHGHHPPKVTTSPWLQRMTSTRDGTTPQREPWRSAGWGPPTGGCPSSRGVWWCVCAHAVSSSPLLFLFRLPPHRVAALVWPLRCGVVWPLPGVEGWGGLWARCLHVVSAHGGADGLAVWCGGGVSA